MSRISLTVPCGTADVELTGRISGLPPGVRLWIHHTEEPADTGGTSPDTPAAAAALLSPEERERAARFHSSRDRHRWIRGRAWVRRRLGGCLHLPPPEVPITAAPGGRLYLTAPASGSVPPDFNLSHTGGWIALGICPGGPASGQGGTAVPASPAARPGFRLGLDLETVDPSFPALEVAEEFFLPAERRWLASGPVERFFQLWTAKEALMKATGLGMFLGPDRIECLSGAASLTETGRITAVRSLEDGTVHRVFSGPGPGGTVFSVVLLPSPGHEPLPL